MAQCNRCRLWKQEMRLAGVPMGVLGSPCAPEGFETLCLLDGLNWDEAGQAKQLWGS